MVKDRIRVVYIDLFVVWDLDLGYGWGMEELWKVLFSKCSWDEGKCWLSGDCGGERGESFELFEWEKEFG